MTSAATGATNGRVGTDARRAALAQHGRTQAACGGVANAPAPNGDVDGSVAGLHSRLAQLHAEAAAIHEMLAQMVEDQLAATARPRHMDGAMPGTLSKPDRMLGVKDVAALLGVDPKTVRRWRRNGDLPPAIDLGSVWRWRREDIDRWIASREEST